MKNAPLRFHNDPGLQPERTALAWNRTIIALALVSMIWLRWSHAFGTAVLAMTTSMLIAVAALYLTQRARYRRAATGLAADRVRADIRGVLALTACMIGFGVGGLTLVLA